MRLRLFTCLLLIVGSQPVLLYAQFSGNNEFILAPTESSTVGRAYVFSQGLRGVEIDFKVDLPAGTTRGQFYESDQPQSVGNPTGSLTLRPSYTKVTYRTTTVGWVYIRLKLFSGAEVIGEQRVRLNLVRGNGSEQAYVDEISPITRLLSFDLIARQHDISWFYEAGAADNNSFTAGWFDLVDLDGRAVSFGVGPKDAFVRSTNPPQSTGLGTGPGPRFFGGENLLDLRRDAITIYSSSVDDFGNFGTEPVLLVCPRNASCVATQEPVLPCDIEELDSRNRVQLAYAGDVNLDGVVGFDDYLTFAKGFGSVGAWSDGDFNCNGEVEFLDYLLLAQNFGE